jgi:hypothetical protein
MPLTIVGLPLTPESVTTQFLEFIDQPDVVCVYASPFSTTNNDYLTAKTGFDLLFERGYQVTQNFDQAFTGRVILSVPLWHDRNTARVADGVLAAYTRITEQDPHKTVCYITPGSPLLYDGVVKNLLLSSDIGTVIDTKSSAQLAIEELVDRGAFAYAPLHVVQDNMKLEENAINILGCVGSVYYTTDVKNITLKLMPQLNIRTDIYKIKLGSDTLIDKLSVPQFVKQLLVDRSTLNDVLFIIKQQ